jgi:hypothetical protein
VPWQENQTRNFYLIKDFMLAALIVNVSGGREVLSALRAGGHQIDNPRGQLATD